MAQWLRALAAHSQDLGFILSTHMTTTRVYNSGFEGYSTHSALLWYCMHVAQRHTCRQDTHTHK